MSGIHVRDVRNDPLFKVMYEDQSAYEKKQHYSVEKPSLSRLAHHPAEGVCECCWQEYDRQHFQKVCKWRRVLIRMSSICVEESAAIRAEIFDDLQCGYWTLWYDLLRTLDGSGDGIGTKVHRNALPDKQQGADQRSRQKDPQQGAGEINPEIAERVGELSGEPTDEGNTDRQPRGASQKVLCAESYHLANVAHRILAGISLPGSGRRETNRGIQGQIRGQRRGVVLWKKPGKKLLHP